MKLAKEWIICTHHCGMPKKVSEPAHRKAHLAAASIIDKVPED